MRRLGALGLAGALVVACTGYDRPSDRRLDAIGAPAAYVASELNATQDHIYYEKKANGPSDALSTNDGLSLPPNDTPARTQKFTEVGQIRKASARRVTLKRPTGDEVELKLGSLTNVTVDGKPATLSAVPEGSEVRASYVVKNGGNVAETLEITTVPNVKKEPAEK